MYSDATQCRVGPGERWYMGEQHSGERQNMDVLAGPRAKQESTAKRYRLGRLAMDGVVLRARGWSGEAWANFGEWEFTCDRAAAVAAYTQAVAKKASR
jgi:hypothetical protein